MGGIFTEILRKLSQNWIKIFKKSKKVKVGSSKRYFQRFPNINRKANFFNSSLYDIKSFDNNKILELLFIGFKTRNSYDIRNMMITILMHFGGCRTSEPFHLFVTDIQEDPNKKNSALVKLYHPEDGYVRYYDKYTNRIIETTRKDFLQKKYNFLPRNMETGTMHAGWKDLALEKTGKYNYSIIFWFPTWSGELFWKLYKIYITKVRPKNISNPYLFVNKHSKSYGLPYTINAFRDSHKNAIKKTGLLYKKELGTTPHAHRHAYGENLSNYIGDKNIIQKALHHKSPFSQMVYTLPSIEKINQKLNDASENFDIDKKIKNNEEEFWLSLKERFLNEQLGFLF